MARKARTVQRRVLFYRVDGGADDAGRPIPVDLLPCLRAVDQLAGDDWYLNEPNGDALCCWLDTTKPRIRIRVARIRRSGLPLVERRRKLRQLSIPSDAGLAEQVHAVFFPKSIVGVEFNFHGPRLTRLSEYLWVKTAYKNVMFRPLLRKDVVDQLAQMGEIRLVDLKIRAEYAQQVAEADSDLGSAFAAAAKAGGAEDVEIILRPRAYSRGHLGDGILRTVRRLSRRRDIREGAAKFIVSGRDSGGEVSEIDVLRDKLLVEAEVSVVEGAAAPVPRSPDMYAAIESAYSTLRAELEETAQLEP